ncbi:MAG: alpha/beta hydrolase [Synechococcales cyanobacterium RM1_1_8]|nr:alpha/beta hydrolase [Synechococcales cyanobacterium RM1_1_8]
MRPSHRYFFRPRPPASHRPLLIYFSGMDGSGQLLQAQLDELATAFDVHCLMLPRDQRLDWAGLAAEVQAQLLPLRHQGRVAGRSLYLCGESFGGCLALQLAAQAPDCLDGLILVNPASSFHRLPLLKLAAPLSGWAPTELYQAFTHLLLQLLVEPGQVAPPERQRLLRAMQQLPAQTAHWRLSLLNQFVLDHAALARFEQPVLILSSQGDRLLPSVEEGDRLLELFPQASQVILPHSGHACLLEQDISLLQLLEESNVLSNCAVSACAGL